jgi:hypothetical protein
MQVLSSLLFQIFEVIMLLDVEVGNLNGLTGLGSPVELPGRADTGYLPLLAVDRVPVSPI